MTTILKASDIAKIDGIVLGLAGQLHDLLERVVETKSTLGVEPNFTPIEIHRGKQVVISDLIVSTNDRDGIAIDEEALPYFVWMNGEERVLLSEDDLVETEGPAEELVTRVCQVFAEARSLGFVGPYHLLEEGTDEQKAEYAKRLYTAYGTRTDYAEARASVLRKQALELLKQAEAIDGKKPQAVLLKWDFGDSELYVENEAVDLSDETNLEQHMGDNYSVSGWRSASVFALSYEDLAD